MKEIRSDNGSNFTGAKKELRVVIEGWSQAKIHEELLQMVFQFAGDLTSRRRLGKNDKMHSKGSRKSS